MKKELGFLNPKDTVLQMGLREGMKVADLGVGSGHYAVVASHLVGETGRVYAIDIQEDILLRLKDDLRRLGRKNVDTVWGNIEKTGGTKLKDHAVDAVILSNVLFQLDEKDKAIAEVKRILAPQGKLLVVDWAGAYEGAGPEHERVVREHDAERMFIDAGFYKVKAFHTGAHHYSILFQAP